MSSRNTRSTRQTSQSPNRLDDIFDLTRSADDVQDVLVQQALLEAVGNVPTPVSPTYHSRSPTSPAYSRRSGRSSIVPPAYDPAQPNAEDNAVPYDPSAWADATVISSDHGSRRSRSRSSTPAFRRSAAHYSPTSPAFSPIARPLSRLPPNLPVSARYAERFPHRAIPRPAPYTPYTPSAIAGGERSPDYMYDGAFDELYFRAYSEAMSSGQLDRIIHRLESMQERFGLPLDHIEAQLEAISDVLSEQMNGSLAPGVTASRGGKKRKCSSSASSKRVSFDTSESDTSFEPSSSDLFPSESDYDDDDNNGGDESRSPSKKPKRSPTPPSKRSPFPRTPPNRGNPSPPRTPRKPAPTRPNPCTPPQQQDPAVPSTPAAPRKSRAASKSPAAQAPRTPPQQVTPAVPATPAAPRQKRAAASETAASPPQAPALPPMRSSARLRAKAASDKPRSGSGKGNLEGSHPCRKPW
jgi:hypothetical protein